MSASTEVQRTLVKSPPELWAELSDPAALARHLSELGDVRITRTEPERAVDWEATAPDGAKASGRVEISPTGWGTRVTFSATGHAGAPTAPAHSEAATPQTPAGEAGVPSPGAHTETETDPFATTDDPGDADTDSHVFAEPLAEADPFLDEAQPGEDDPVDDPLDEDDPVEDPYSNDDPYLDDDPYADDDIDDEDGDEVLVRGDLAIAHQRDDASAAEPRRGFFARLFGFARRPIPESRASRETAQPAYEPYEDIAGQLPPPELPSSMAMAEQVTMSYEDLGARPPASDLRIEPLSSELAALDAATLARAHAAEQAPDVGVGEVADPADPHPAPAEPAGAQGALAQSGLIEAAPVAPAPAGAPGDIAGELRTAEEIAAEEVAAEQVEAVLTSALDRLGSAHHRPFSRG